MGLFSLFKRPKFIEDEYFGKLRLVTFKDSSKNYFEGKVKFHPTGVEVMIMLDAVADKPTAAQRSFYKNIEEHIDNYITKFTGNIEHELGEWIPGFKIKDFHGEFQLVYVNIPGLQIEPVEWELTFETYHAGSHHIVVLFAGENVDRVLVDA
ncbi:hypothetical protein COR50_13895 [Chitinophaga caeni]|uniref:DUF2262 domain-containing protein n=1 Tax=Chitinophaga caeni TaxID=2029983 RepID=A0A291QW52_9BACT|nr:hypothetical protein [Chitinophaga caeni]ATL48167.1 hypothetical protein COR50_13895 [Chitinophaga caeni]